MLIYWLRRLWDWGRYDVALSLRGSDPHTRLVGKHLNTMLRRTGLRVFFYEDKEHLIRLIGTNIPENLPKIYGQKAHQVILIGSANYGGGYTSFEWEAILARRKRSDEEFLIPFSTVPKSELPHDCCGTP